ncbi:MAG: hypothetical protein HGB12_11295 [Bacteroidetes bacterium]|nr:hypothetical protein [Bacteroidota bacterium]
MKTTLIYATLILTLSITLYSCQPDNNSNTPQPTGDTRDKFVDTWSCQEQSKLNGNSSFMVNISLNSNNSSQINISNFYQLGASYKVYGIVADNSVTLPNQTVNGFTVKSGSGNITNNNNQITWNYVIDDGADLDTCTAVFSK